MEKPRELCPEEDEKLRRDINLLSDFKQRKLEEEAQKNWDLFYKRNTTKFFKDRHWTTREFEELIHSQDKVESPRLLEVGCGVGNFMFPLIEESPNIYIYACDFSPRAVQFVKENEHYDEKRCCAFWCDITSSPLTDNIPAASLNIVTIIFVLSAIHPDKMAAALQNIHTVLKSGGCVLFRDYGLHDYAQLRFGPGHKLQENFYVRQDGTRAYYFSKGEVESLFGRCGFVSTTCEYILRETVNKKEGLCVPRVFVQGKFSKSNHKINKAADALDIEKNVRTKEADCSYSSPSANPEATSETSFLDPAVAANKDWNVKPKADSGDVAPEKRELKMNRNSSTS